MADFAHVLDEHGTYDTRGKRSRDRERIATGKLEDRACKPPDCHTRECDVAKPVAEKREPLLHEVGAHDGRCKPY